MLSSLKPTDSEIESLALAETDPRQQARFAPLRCGFFGNLAILLCAGACGLLHALIAHLGRRLFSSSRDGRH